MVLRQELSDPSVVAWLRMLDRKPWALCVPYEAGGTWHEAYPDFLFFRETASGIVADIVDPHWLRDESAWQRAAALARYAGDHLDRFGRIVLVIVDDETVKRLDLTDAETRRRVAAVTSHQHLRSLFERV
jgi:type III restriction enzyme